jgi:hypothetical protein
MTQTQSPSARSPLLADALALLGLSGLAIAQPLLGVLGRAAEFFVASRTRPLDLALFLALVCLVIPAFLFGLERLAGLLGRRAGDAARGSLAGLLGAMIVLPLLKRLGSLPPLALLPPAAAAGVALGLGYLRFRPLRAFLAWFSLAVLVVPANFVFNTGASRILFSPPAAETPPPPVTVRAPVVVVIFDELPLTSLLSERGRIDPVRYPHFAELAAGSCWFRNATSVSTLTLRALPAILSGSYPKPGLMPTASDYPHTLFTLFGGSYEMQVLEPSTHLCPDRFGAPLRAPSGFGERMAGLLEDAAIVYGHILLPDAWAARLPSVSDRWNDFAGRDQTPAGARSRAGVPQSPPAPADRLAQFEEFALSIRPPERPVLYFAHVEFPHPPFQYLPSGKIYARDHFVNEGLRNGVWVEDAAPVLYHYQRHLLQVGFTDRLLGDLIARLKESGLYDPALIVVMADHGVSFIPGQLHRGLSEANAQDILPVPLFVKLPGQREGLISDRPVATIDVLPTIADRLGIPLPWAVEGRSAFDLAPARTEIRTEGGGRLNGPVSIDRIQDAVRRKTTLFGGECPWDRLFKAGPCPGLIDRRLSEISVETKPAAGLELDSAEAYDAVDPLSDFVPVRVQGRIIGDGGPGGPLRLAIAVNGTIRATTEAYPWRGRPHEFAALVPEESFRPGANAVRVFLVSGTGERPRLQPVADLTRQSIRDK